MTASIALSPPPAPAVAPIVLSVDLGRTATKTTISRDPKQTVAIPANVACLTVDQVRQGDFAARASDPLLDIWLEYQGRGYAIGQLAADFGAPLGVGQSKLQDALVKTFASIGYFGLSGDIAVALGLPYYSQEQFDREKQAAIATLQAPHLMVYRGETVAVDIRKVWVMPEGYGSLLWCDADTRKSAPDLAGVSAAVVDIGHQTTDFLAVDRFRFARGTSRSEPFAMAQFYSQVAAQIAGADSQSLALIAAVHRPEGERFYRPRGETRPTDLDAMLPSLRRSFARELSDRLMGWLPERVEDVIVCGGGGEFFWPDLRALFKEAKLRAHLAKPSRLSNALGQYLYGEAQMAILGQQADRAEG